MAKIKHNFGEFFLVEDEPKIRTIILKTDKKEFLFNLSFPYVYYFVDFRNDYLLGTHNYYLTIMLSPKSVKDPFKGNFYNFRNFPNNYSFGFCLGHDTRYQLLKYKNKKDKINFLISSFWQTSFSCCELDSYTYITKFEEWQKQTKKDPRFSINNFDFVALVNSPPLALDRGDGDIIGFKRGEEV